MSLIRALAFSERGSMTTRKSSARLQRIQNSVKRKRPIFNIRNEPDSAVRECNRGVNFLAFGIHRLGDVEDGQDPGDLEPDGDVRDEHTGALARKTQITIC